MSPCYRTSGTMALHDRTGGPSVPSLGEWAATGIGFVVALVGVMYVVASPDPFEQWWIELAAAGAMPAVLMYGGYWLATNDFDQTEVYTVAQGWFVGVVALSVVAGWAVVAARPGERIVVESLFHLVSVASAGAVLGLAFGLHTTRLTEQFGASAAASDVDTTGDDATSSARAAATPSAAASADADATAERTGIESLLDDRSIADDRRRRVVRALAERDAVAVSPGDIAADLESEWAARNRAAIAAELHHVHLPKLDDAGVVEYDAEATTARLRDDDRAAVVK